MFAAAVKRLAARAAVAIGMARIVRFRHDTNGATAVEFALVAVPFIAIMFAIVETALTFFAQQAMETAVQNAARLIRTGQAQKAGMTPFEFKGKICTQIEIMFNCMSGLSMDVRKYPTFDSINLSKPINDDGELVTDDFDYEPGKGGDIVVVRAYYKWPVLINFLGMNNYGDLAGGTHLIATTAAFKNEPFPW